MTALLLLAACAPAEPEAVQSPVSAWLVVHVDPLAREGGIPCTVEGLTRCGEPVPESWRERVDNLRWLVDRWIEAGRTMDVQLGPEMSLALAEDPVALDVLVEKSGWGEDGARAVAEEGRAALADGLAAGALTLGVHVHSVMPDADGVWGSAPKRSEGAEPCDAWAEDPRIEGSPMWAERVAAYGAWSADALAGMLGAELWTYTGHLPLSMAGKVQVVEDPDGIDPEVETAFPERFHPADLGSAYSECLQQFVDHPPFEPWPADEAQALLAGDGPPVIPGGRVSGSLEVHLGAYGDSSGQALARQFFQLLLNWRWTALTEGDRGRPWTWTWHTHLFDIDAGEPAPRAPEARGSNTREGSAFRGDLLEVAELLDEFAARSEWAGVASLGGGVVEWRLPAEGPGAEGSGFSYGRADAPPPDALDREVYPYLPLVAERLARSHLACRGTWRGVEVWGFLRCPDHWVWGEDLPGYSCADGRSPAGVYVLVPSAPTCIDVPDGVVRAAPVDADELGEPTWCAEGLEVPFQGLIVEPREGLGWLGEACAPL